MKNVRMDHFLMVMIDLDPIVFERQEDLSTDDHHVYHVGHMHWAFSRNMDMCIELFPKSETARITMAESDICEQEIHMLCANRNSLKELLEDVVHFAHLKTKKG